MARLRLSCRDVSYPIPIPLHVVKQENCLNNGLLAHLLMVSSIHIVVLLHSHLLREGAVRDPLRGLSWSTLFHHLINLLKRQALSLRNEEVGEEDAGTASSSPYEEDLGA